MKVTIKDNAATSLIVAERDEAASIAIKQHLVIERVKSTLRHRVHSIWAKELLEWIEANDVSPPQSRSPHEEKP